MNWKALCVALSFLATPTLWGQEDIDNLFTDAAPDLVAQPPTKVDLAGLNTAPLSVAGHANANGGALIGNDPNGFYNFTTDFTLEARPDPSIRFHGLVTTGVVNLAVQAPTFAELYLDYTLLNTFLFRMGKYTLSWTQARFFSSEDDLMSDSPSGATFKAFAPVLGQSLTAVVLANPSVMLNPAVPAPRELAYAGQLSGDLGPFGWGVSMLVRPGTVLATPERNGSVFAKTSWLGVDWYAEGFVLARAWQPTPQQVHYLTGFFWEGGDPKWQLQGEATDKHWGAAVKLTGLALTPGLHWEQSRVDGSGELIAGAEWAPLPHLTLDFGVPWLYGSDTSEYLLNDADTHKQRVGFALKITLDTQF